MQLPTLLQVLEKSLENANKEKFSSTIFCPSSKKELFMIFGHQKNLFFLSKKISQKILPQSFIFFGPEKIGKRKIAFEIGKYLLGEHQESFFDFSKKDCFCQICNLIEKKIHPDFFEIKTSNEISINEIREIKEKERLSSKNFKIFIIDNAQKLTSEAKGALLKILEEPRTKTIFFLITSILEALPKTILSRSFLLRFEPLSREEIKNFVLNSKIENLNEIEEIVDLSLGRPGMAKELILDEKKLKVQKKLFSLISKLKTKHFFERFLLAKYLEKNDLIQDFLLLLSFVLEEILHFKETSKYFYFFEKKREIENLSQDFSKKEILELLKEVLEIKNYLSFFNLNKLLAIENLLLKF